MKRSAMLSALLSTLLSVAPLAACPQLLPEASLREAKGRGAAEPLRYLVQEPAGHTDGARCPVLLLWGDGAGDLAAVKAANEAWGRELARAGFLVVSPLDIAAEVSLAPLFAQLRQTLRIDQGGLHAAGGGSGAARAIRVVLQQPHEFQTLTVWGGVDHAAVAKVERLHERRVRVLEAPSPAELAAHCLALHHERAETGVVGEVAQTLDDFHQAAATGDEARYFAILPDDAVFLGTDATERWTGAEFRAFAMPYFQRDSAWTYVPLRRHVSLAPDGALAWFDEVLDNEAYGECRGSGVLVRRDGAWVLRQYNLTVPVPNDLMRGVTARIRAFAEGAAPAETTVLVVRHAEKASDGDDPELSEAGRLRAEQLARVLRDLPVKAAYASPYRRTAATVEPLCRDRHLAATTYAAADAKGLVARLRREHLGETVLVCGHSNTVPTIVKALGVEAPVAVADDDYDWLFVVRLGPDGARLLALHYGDVGR